MFQYLQTQISGLINRIAAVWLTLYGVAATGQLRVGTVVNNETIAINGVTFTAKAASPSGAVQYLIGATAEETAANLAAILNASVNASISVATYEAFADKINITYDATGAIGNVFTLAESSSANIGVSGATLAGGVGGLPTRAWTVVSSSAASVSPTAANSGTYYRLSHATPTFTLPTTSLVVGETEFWVTFTGGTPTAGVVDAGAGKTIDVSTFNATLGSAEGSIAALLTFRLYHIKYVATNTWASDLVYVS